MPKPRRPAGSGEVGFDEQAHRPSLTRHPQLGAQATRDRRVDRACFLSRSRDGYRDRGGDEPILRPEGAQRVNRDQSRLAAELEGRLGPRYADRPWEFSCRNSHCRQIRRGLSRRTGCGLLWDGSLSPDRGCRCRRSRYFRLAAFLGSSGWHLRPAAVAPSMSAPAPRWSAPGDRAPRAGRQEAAAVPQSPRQNSSLFAQAWNKEKRTVVTTARTPSRI